MKPLTLSLFLPVLTLAALLVLGVPRSAAQDDADEPILRVEPIEWELILPDDLPEADRETLAETRREQVLTGISRSKVPGGWLLFFERAGQGGCTFYPDADHVWDGGSLR